MSGPGYPKTILEFAAQFHDDEVCYQYLIKSRWPEGFVCPHCSMSGGWWLTKYKRFECKECHRQTSPLSGTLMHRTHLPIRQWFWATYLVATHTPGISAVQLQRQLGIAKNDTAWFLLHRLRQGMVRANRDPLNGHIEADETHVGGPAKDKRGRGVRTASHKSLVGGAIEIQTYQNKKGEWVERAGRLRLQILPSASASEIKKFLNAHVQKNSAVRTDGWRGYSAEIMKDYRHFKHVQGSPERAKEIAPHIHQAFSNLKSWLIGIHHGVDPKYLQAYLDEFVFRFNRREYPMAAFRSLLGIVSTKSPLPLRELVKP